MLEIFIIGLVGSLHCVGMCGPIAFSLPSGGAARWKFLSGRVLYNLGRIITYSLLGGVIALIGMGANMFHAQQVLSIVLGVLLLIWAVKEAGWIQIPMTLGITQKVTEWIRKGFSKFFAKGSLNSMFTVGLLNGLLPCGFVYMGLVYAAMSLTPLEGMSKMALFGAGTFPVMFALSVLGPAVTGRMKSYVNRIVPYTIMVVGLLFVLRGMALGIPYLSPKMDVDPGGKVEMTCCHPKN